MTLCLRCDQEENAPGKVLCPGCGSIRGLEWYYANRTDQNKKATARYHADPTRQKRRMKDNHAAKKAVVDSYKASPCADCKGSFPVECMDFDHLHSKKECVGTLLSRGAPVEVIVAEIQKCEVVCSNCHRIRTARRRKEAP